MAVRHHMIIIHLSPQNWMHGFMRVAMNHNESARNVQQPLSYAVGKPWWGG